MSFESMQYDFKLIPLHRETEEPALDPDSVRPQFTIDIAEFHRTMLAAQQMLEAERLRELTDEDIKQAFVQAVAEILSELFGADVYYRAAESNDAFRYLRADRDSEIVTNRDALSKALTEAQQAHPDVLHMIVSPLWERASDYETDPEFRDQVGVQAQELADSEQVSVAIIGEPKENLTPEDFLATFEPKPRG